MRYWKYTAPRNIQLPKNPCDSLHWMNSVISFKPFISITMRASDCDLVSSADLPAEHPTFTQRFSMNVSKASLPQSSLSIVLSLSPGPQSLSMNGITHPWKSEVEVAFTVPVLLPTLLITTLIGKQIGYWSHTKRSCFPASPSVPTLAHAATPCHSFHCHLNCSRSSTSSPLLTHFKPVSAVQQKKFYRLVPRLHCWVGEMAQWLRLLLRRTRVWFLRSRGCNYSSRGSDTTFWPPWVLILTYVYTHNFEKDSVFKPFHDFLFSSDKEQLISML